MLKVVLQKVQNVAESHLHEEKSSRGLLSNFPLLCFYPINLLHKHACLFHQFHRFGISDSLLSACTWNVSETMRPEPMKDAGSTFPHVWSASFSATSCILSRLERSGGRIREKLPSLANFVTLSFIQFTLISSDVLFYLSLSYHHLLQPLEPSAEHGWLSFIALVHCEVCSRYISTS